MMDYQTFAAGLSFLLVVLYAFLSAIAFRRARYIPDAPLTERVLVHARRVEGPIFTSLLFTAIILAMTALTINTGQYGDLVRFLFGTLRGALLVVGLYILGYYWQVRETWR